MNYSFAFTLIVLLKLCSATPQEPRTASTTAEHKSEAMTAAAVNSGIQVATGFITIFQTMLNNFWTALPTVVNMFASPTAAGTPSVPNVPGVGGGVQNPLGQFGGPIRQMKSSTVDETSNELIEIINDNIESFADNVRVWEIRGPTARA